MSNKWFPICYFLCKIFFRCHIILLSHIAKLFHKDHNGHTSAILPPIMRVSSLITKHHDPNLVWPWVHNHGLSISYMNWVLSCFNVTSHDYNLRHNVGGRYCKVLSDVTINVNWLLGFNLFKHWIDVVNAFITQMKMYVDLNLLQKQKIFLKPWKINWNSISFW